MGKGIFSLPAMRVPPELFAGARPNGGLDLSQRPTDIADGASQDMDNFIYRGGALRLRPGLRLALAQEYGPVVDIFPRDGSLLLRRFVVNGETVEEKYGVYIAAQGAILAFDGTTAERVADSMSYDGGWASAYTDRKFSRCSFIPSGSAGGQSLESGGDSYSVTGEKVYLVGDGYFLAVEPKLVVYENPTAVPHVTAACLVGEVAAYTPVLYEDCAPGGAGTKAESRNLISKNCIQEFSTDAQSFLYKLCDENIDNDYVTMTYSTALGSIYTFTFEPGNNLAVSAGIGAVLDRAAGTITFLVTLIDAHSLGLESNLSVSYSKTPDEDPVRNAAFGLFFDGGTQTAAGYSRLFISGYGGAPNRIYCSAQGDTSYFAADAYVDVGAADDPVTALGLQYDILAVFKKGSIYSLSYSDGGSASDFTVKEVNSTVGCDLPGTLRLNSNQLFWASSAGGVYVLESTSVKDERAVRLLSQNVNKRLLALPDEELGAASAVADGSTYFLLAGKSVFVLDCDLLHFTCGKPPQGIAWHCWTLPQRLSGVFRLGGQYAASADGGEIYRFDEGAADDAGNFFDAHWYSKSFDFGLPGEQKRVCRFSLAFCGAKPGKAVVVYRDAAGESRRTAAVDTRGDGGVTLTFRPASALSESASIGIRRVKGELSPLCLTSFSLRADSQSDDTWS